jgi:hypothetical protein
MELVFAIGVVGVAIYSLFALRSKDGNRRRRAKQDLRGCALYVAIGIGYLAAVALYSAVFKA